MIDDIRRLLQLTAEHTASTHKRILVSRAALERAVETFERSTLAYLRSCDLLVAGRRADGARLTAASDGAWKSVHKPRGAPNAPVRRMDA